MKQTRNLPRLVLASALLLAFAAPEDELGFHPPESTVLTKSFQAQSESTLEDMTIVNNGQEMDTGQFGVEMTATTKYLVAVTDEYAALGEGRATKLVRRFDEIDMSSSVSMSNAMMGDTSMEMTGSSELEGVRVVFTWNPESESYVASFPEGVEGDEDLLEGLEASMDLVGLLPGSEVAEGDTWSVEPAALRPLFSPGGDVKLDVEMPDEDMMGGMGSQPTPDQYIGDLEGEVSAEYAGTRDEGGTKVAVIKLAVDIFSSRDISDLAEDMVSEQMEEQGIEMDVESMDSEFSFEGEGELLWNLELGLLHSLELSGENSMTIDTSMQISVQGQQMSMEQSMTFGGSQTISVTTEKTS